MNDDDWEDCDDNDKCDYANFDEIRKDDFAMAAMAAAFRSGDRRYQIIAVEAYNMAEAMLEEKHNREQRSN